MNVTASEILNFRFSPGALSTRGSHIVATDTQRLLKSRQQVLASIAARHEGFESEVPVDASAVVGRFYMATADGIAGVSKAFGTKRDLRKLAWCLSVDAEGYPRIAESHHLPLALEVLRSAAGTAVTLALFHAVLKNWEHRDAAGLLRDELLLRVQSYSGKRSQVLQIKKNAEYYLDVRGAVKLAGNMVAKEVALADVWAFLKIPAQMRSYAYFTAVAEAYVHFESRRSTFVLQLPSVVRFLDEHQREVGRKIVLSATIRSLAEMSGNESSRDLMLTAAIRQIGDPAEQQKWQPWDGATEGHAATLEAARRILNQWIAQRFIVVFFEKVAMDRDRKEFWLEYAQHVEQFKIFGDYETERRILRDSRIAGYADGRFQIVNGSVSALLMAIRDKRIVEFSKNGNACYIFDAGNSVAPRFDKPYADVDDFKPKSHRVLIYQSSGYEISELRKEGRMLHQPRGVWQKKFRKWISSVLGI